MNIWAVCEGDQCKKNMSLEPWRVVEAQHILSSRDLVDSWDEHDVLEALIESTKPLVQQEKNYLIFTPFRYPPLKYGSRFGRVFEPSIWYGSLALETAFTEVAYYRLKFLNDTSGDLGYLDISMTAFTAFLKTSNGIDLSGHPFDKFLEKISNKNTYEDSQLLGTIMRSQSIDAFIYTSARANNNAKNVGVFTPNVFRMKQNQYIANQQTWLCLANTEVIEFVRISFLGKEHFSFPKHFFTHENRGNAHKK